MQNLKQQWVKGFVYLFLNLDFGLWVRITVLWDKLPLHFSLVWINHTFLYKSGYADILYCLSAKRHREYLIFFWWKIKIYFIEWTPSVIFSRVAAPLVKILPMAFMRWNKFWSFTEKKNKYSVYFMLLTLSGRSFIKIQYSSFSLFLVAYPFRIAISFPLLVFVCIFSMCVITIVLDQLFMEKTMWYCSSAGVISVIRMQKLPHFTSNLETF